MNATGKIAYVIAIIGAINWGLVGFFNWNLVDAIFGGTVALNSSIISRIIYALVGLSGIALLFFLPVKRDVSSRAGAPRRGEARA